MNELTRKKPEWISPRNMKDKDRPNFVCVHSVDEANRVDLVEYRFEKHSDSDGFIFVRRAKRIGM